MHPSHCSPSLFLRIFTIHHRFRPSQHSPLPLYPFFDNLTHHFRNASLSEKGMIAKGLIEWCPLEELHQLDSMEEARIRRSLAESFTEPNDHDHGTEENAARMLAVSKDHIQVGMAANLRDYILTNSDGNQVKGSEVLTYDGSPVGYAMQPVETINYVSAHDNQTLFDIISLKTATNITVDERCRLNHIASSIIALSQGIPFFHAGDELLRSKSLDRDSYNSGDWFNKLDFSYNFDNWGIGLPPKDHNGDNWPLYKPRLADPSYKPSKNHIIATVENFTNLLQIRYSSPLFRLRTAKDIQDRVRFHNNGPSWVPGVIVMSIDDDMPGWSQLDAKFKYIVVIINVRPTEVSYVNPDLRARSLQLHPVLATSNDMIVKESKYEPSSGCFTVPAKTTAVFVEPRYASR